MIFSNFGLKTLSITRHSLSFIKLSGYKSKAACHDGEGILHRAFSIFIFNDKKQLLIQKRSGQKRLWPLYWTNTCCSHPRQNEDNMTATDKREDLSGSSNDSSLILPVLPLRDVVVYPHMVIPLFVGREKSIKALEVAMIADKQILLVAQKNLRPRSMDLSYAILREFLNG